MNTFHFEVDEDYAKQHNELLQDTKSMVISGIAIFVLCVLGGIASWIFISPTSPWRLLASVGLILFGVMMLIVALLLPKSVGKNASEQGPARWAITSRVVKRIPNTHDTVGTKVPVVAVGGQRTSRDKNTWQVITPMPIAWATPDTQVISRARAEIPQDQWQRLEKARKDAELVASAKNSLIALS